MSVYASLCSLFLLTFLARSYAQQQDPNYINHVCPNTTTYTKNSTYSSNLRTLLNSFTSNTLFSSNGFYSTAVGQSPNVVFGVFVCRGDVLPEACRACVVFATKTILLQCPVEKKGFIWYDECMVRYVDQRFLVDSSFQDGDGIIMGSNESVSSNQVNRFRGLVLSTLNQSVNEAASSSRKFDARKTNWSGNISLYSLVQCTPDLTSFYCLSCLQQSINELNLSRIGGRVILPSCNSRYELYPFYNETNVRTPQLQLDSEPPLPPPPPPPLAHSPGPGLNILFTFESFKFC